MAGFSEARPSVPQSPTSELRDPFADSGADSSSATSTRSESSALHVVPVRVPLEDEIVCSRSQQSFF